MTATINIRGEIILKVERKERLALKSGEIFVAKLQKSGRVILKRAAQTSPKPASAKSYLTPPPLSPRERNQLYRKKDSAWEKVEDAAVTQGRRSLKGMTLEDL